MNKPILQHVWKRRSYFSDTWECLYCDDWFVGKKKDGAVETCPARLRLKEEQEDNRRHNKP